MILLALASWLCLLTWSFADPSMNNATHRSVQNLLGILGAAWADLIMQLFGLASVLLFLPIAAWGWHLATKTYPVAPRIRMIMWPVAAALVTLAFAMSPFVVKWPLPHGLGGIIGDFLLEQLRPGQLGPVVRAMIGVTALISGLIFLLFVSGIRLAELWNMWAVDMRQIGRLASSVVAPVYREGADWISSVSLSKSKEQFSEWRHILDRMEREEDGHWPDFNHETPAATTSAPFEDERIEPHFGVAPAAPSYTGGTPNSHTLVVDPRDLRYKSPHVRRPKHKNTHAKSKAANRRQQELPLDDNGSWSDASQSFRLPALKLLNKAPLGGHNPGYAVEALQQNARQLEGILQDFGVKGEVVRAHPGPVVTLYELEPARGVKTSRVIGLADDIARSMSAVSARVAVIPGRNAIGIELPNETREMVYLRDMFESKSFAHADAKLPLALGKDISGEPVIADLTRMPHLLIAGTTGSGKSVGINTMIASLLYRLTPAECKLILIDPKMLELSVYEGIPHLLTPVVTDPRKAIAALKWTIREMEERYKKMSKLGVRNITGFNARIRENIESDGVLSRKVQTGFDRKTGKPIYETEEMDFEAMPFIVVVIDEMADLMMVAGKDIEAAVQRLAQMARAAGIHLITATQRPSVDVITGTIKANFPTRVSFRVTSKVDSRTILGEQGAEQLLGDGDMLYMSGGGTVTRVHGPFVSDEEIESLVDHLKTQGVPEYLESITEELGGADEEELGPQNGSSGDRLYDEAVAIVLRDRKATTSYIQRRLSIGYNKAARLIERMEDEGLITPLSRSGKREILVDPVDE